MNIPLVSVVMPSYNNLRDIGSAIDSVLAQTLDSWELIIVDDASTDKTVEYIKDNYQDDRILVEAMTSNRGSGACRNHAISLSKGAYIAVLDADDECLPTRFEKQVDILCNNPKTAVVASQVLEFGNWGGPIVGTWPTDPYSIAKRQRTNKMPVPHPSVMFRREALIRAGAYDVTCRRAQDFALFLKLKDSEIICIAEPLVKYRTQRPISLKYAIRNEMFVSLALRRHVLSSHGLDNKMLPTTPNLTLIVLIKGLKNWAVRTGRESLSSSFRWVRALKCKWFKA